jgi:ABC-2 type transport system ATP-binding protein
MREVASYGVVALTSAPPTLEQLFMRHYGDDLAVAEASVA